MEACFQSEAWQQQEKALSAKTFKKGFSCFCQILMLNTEAQRHRDFIL
jgi:hypothetical protein